MKSSKSHKSYTRTLNSSAIIGGAQGIDLIIRMFRTKIVAMLLGPSGVGLIGLFQSMNELAGQLSGLGIRASAVREVAEAHGSGDFERLGRTVKVLRRTCWVTGLLGWLLTLALARPLSIWAFGNSELAWALALLGAVLLLDSVSGGQIALLQGVRRIEDLARVLIFSSVTGTVVSIALYAWLGEQGIVPALIICAAVNLGFSWWLSSRLKIPLPEMKWHEITRGARPLISLGLAFMWSGLLTTGVGFATRGFIIRGFGIDANGIYQAAWGISGLFAGFVLNAMGQDFYPRLTAVAAQNEKVNLLVNEQTEVGILLALPGLLTTLAFSPLVIQIFYTGKFIAAAEMLPWFVLGIFGRVISWPLGFIQMAKGASRIFAGTETASHALHLLFIWFGLQYLGLSGVAVAFAALYVCHAAISFGIAFRLSGFLWSAEVLKMIGCSVLFISIQFCILKLLATLPAAIASVALVACTTFYCLHGLVRRVGPEHRISRLVTAVPGIGRCFKP